jgi:iron complex outermembrane recepter protein
MRTFEFRTVQKASIALCALFLIKTVAYARADEPIPQTFDIGPQSLAPALTSFARQSHEEILFAPEVVATKRTAGVKGTMTALVALKVLLKDSGLPFSSTPSGAILVGSPASNATQSASPTPSPSDDSHTQEVGKKSSQDFRVAQVDQANPRPSAVGNANQSSTSGQGAGPALTEIIVTAQKREERLQDVPVPVTAISAETLLNQNVVAIKDFYSMVPGLNFTTGGFINGGSSISIRGLTTGGGSPTASILVDDAPYGASAGTATESSNPVPDIDPSDLDHIEILRGPQGTLYGADSMGGLIKYVTADPSTAGVSARVQAGTSSVYNGAELGYNFRAAVNVPLSDTWAVRLSGFTRLDPGYIDDPGLGVDGVNKQEVDGGHLSALWRPSESFSLKLSALYQDSRLYGSPEVDVGPGLADLQQSRIPGTGWFDKSSQVYSAAVKAKLGDFDLTSISAFNVNEWSTLVDYSYGVPDWTLPLAGRTNKFTQEVRLSSSIGEKFDWLFGAFYTHEGNTASENILTENAGTGAVTGDLAAYTFPFTYSEYAAFADLTYHFTDRFNVQIGGRESHIRQATGETLTGCYAGICNTVYPTQVSNVSPFTWLVTPQYKLSTDLMLYARAASGFRPGGPNTAIAIAQGAPRDFDSDSTRNYEIGVKGDFLDRRLSVDASLYYIDWNNIQLPFLTSAYTAYTSNGSRAKSEGAELSIQSRPLTGMTIGAWVAWDNAVITEPSPPAPPGALSPGLVPGERLPFTSRFSANVSLDQRFPLSGSLTGFVGADVSYVGDRVNAVGQGEGTVIGQYPSYTKIDLRGGADYGSWTVNLIATNLSDQRGIVGGGPGSANPAAFYYITPRTVGLNLVKTF